MPRRPRRAEAAAWAALAGLALTALAACDDAGVTLPPGTNAAKARTLVIDPYVLVDAPLDRVSAHLGVDGAPAADAAPAAAEAQIQVYDDARVSLVRVGPATDCALAPGALFPDPTAAPTDPAFYDFAALDAALAAVASTRLGAAIWHASPPAAGRCGRPAATDPAAAPALADDAEAARFAAIVQSTWRHLTADPTLPRPALVALLDDPLGALGWDAADLDALFARYGALAAPLAADGARVAGVGFALGGADLAALAAADEAHPLARFISWVAAHDASLDVLTLSVTTDTPHGVVDLARAVRALLDAAGPRLAATELLLTAMTPTARAVRGAAARADAFRGAFEAAARVYLQDVRGVYGALSGPGPSPWFDAAGAPSPALLLSLPLRQVDGQRRVAIAAGADREAFAVSASLPADDDGVLSVLIADADVDGGAAALTWTLTVDAFVPPAVTRVPYRLSRLDQTATGVPSFVFHDVGELVPDPRTGAVRLSRELTVPGVHYLELERPF